MGKLFALVLVLAAIFTACYCIGQPAYATVMALFGITIGGLTGALGGVIIGTNVLGQNYEQAFRRWSLLGLGAMTGLIFVWTAVLDLLHGGLFHSFFENLWYATFRLSLTSSVLACGIMVTWGYLVYSRRKANQG